MGRLGPMLWIRFLARPPEHRANLLDAVGRIVPGATGRRRRLPEPHSVKGARLSRGRRLTEEA